MANSKKVLVSSQVKMLYQKKQEVKFLLINDDAHP
jgi:hypothetical protein